MYNLLKYREGSFITTKVGARVCLTCSRDYPRRKKEKGVRLPLAEAASKASANARKTHCPRGHEYTAENTYLSKNQVEAGLGTIRKCKTCVAARDKQKRLDGKVKSRAGKLITGVNRSSRAKPKNQHKKIAPRQFCKRNHPLSGQNLVLVGARRARQCRICTRARKRKDWAEAA